MSRFLKLSNLIAKVGLLFFAIHLQLSSQTFTKITTGAPVTEAGAWRSVNWVDYDRDGDLDLFVTRGLSGGQDNILFRNDGGPGFTFTRMSGLSISQDGRASDGSTWADYDNDGYPDAFTVNWYNQNNLMYHNDGNGTFTQILAGPNVNDGGYSETASWGDYNNDGLVDLYVANSGGPRINYLYKNTGNGQFVKITAGPQSANVGTSRGVNWVDYDDDGDLDLFVANESNENEFLYKNMLIESGIDTFQRITTGPLVNVGLASWSGSWADYDNDGDKDVFVANWVGQASRLFVNNANGTFTPDTADPIHSDGGYGASAGWGDIDNDGDLDLIVTHAYSTTATVNYLYRNLLAETDTARFERVLAGQMVTDPGYMYGTAWGDYDGDGDLDLFVARTQGENQVNAFYSNNGNANHWLTVDLRGTISNAAAIGAKVRVKAVLGGSPTWLTRVVEGQAGYCGQNLQLHFGLRDAISIDSLVILWPSGNIETFTGVEVDKHLVVAEYDSTPIVQVSPPQGFLNDAPEISLKWRRPVYYPPYRLQVSMDSTFAGGIVADTVVGGDTAATVRILSNFTRYYWRVKPARSIHDSMWSAVRDFDNDVLLPDQSVLVHPADSAVNVPISTDVRWSRAARATAYRLRLGTDSLFTTTVFDTTIIDTIFSPGTMPYLTAYFWDVQTENLTGVGPVSARAGFTTIIQAPEMAVLHAPPEAANEVGVPTTLTWLGAIRAATYQVQVSAESLFYPTVVRDTIVADTSLPESDLGSLKTYYWRARSVNAGGQSTFTNFRRFRTVIISPVLIQPVQGSSQFSDVTFVWSPSPPATSYHIQCGLDSNFASLEFEDSTLLSTSTGVMSLQTDTTYYWRMRARHPESTSPWTSVRYFETSPDTFNDSATSAWNLVSLPGLVADRRGAAVFPGALTPFYNFDSGYVVEDTLEYGTGYWVRLTPGSLIEIAGTKRFTDTVDVHSGWNLFGGLSEPIAVTSIGTIPAGLISSTVFGYDGDFRTVDTLRPGRGYWIMMAQSGKLVLDISSPFTTRNRLILSAEAAEPPLPPGERAAVSATLPERAALSPNYPNPFNPSTAIRFQIPEGGKVRLEVYNAIGERVALLVDVYYEAGYHSVVWNAFDHPSGIFYVRMVATGFREVRSMVLLK